MIDTLFNNNINFLNIKSYYSLYQSKISIIRIYDQRIESNTKYDKDYFHRLEILNNIFLSNVLKRYGISIIRFDKNCIIIKYMEFEIKLYIYSSNYDTTIKNLKFECSKYLINQNIEDYLKFVIDQNWGLIIDLTDKSFEASNSTEVEKNVSDLFEVILS